MFTVAWYCLGLSALLQILAFLFTQWSVGFRKFVSTRVVGDLEEADAFYVVPEKYVGSAEIVPCERRTLVRDELQACTAWAHAWTHAWTHMQACAPWTGHLLISPVPYAAAARGPERDH